LVSSTKFAETVASKVLKIYPLAFIAGKIDRKVMLSGRGTLADCCDVLPHVSGRIIDVMG
jgi:hypothetical protein